MDINLEEYYATIKTTNMAELLHLNQISLTSRV